MKYTVIVVDHITDEYIYTVEADSRDHAREEAEQIHLDTPREMSNSVVVERDVIVDGEGVDA